MGRKLQKQKASAETFADLVARLAAGDDTIAAEADRQLRAVIASAEAGDTAAMSTLRDALRKVPDMWSNFGDVARAAEDAQLKMVCGDNLPFREGLQRRLKEMRAELAGTDCSPLERLLVARVAACWLQVQYADAMYAQKSRELDLRWCEYYQRRQDRANKRFLSACKALAQVRKLLKPKIAQVNIGAQQVNVAQAGVDAASVTNAETAAAAAADVVQSLPRTDIEDAQRSDQGGQ